MLIFGDHLCFPAALFQWMRGSGVKMKSLKNPSNEVIRQNQHTQTKEQVLNITSARKKLANILYQAHKNCSNQTTF